ncbi:MAG: deoxyribonuclease IV [Acidobacteria bacterium]|nr:deoxyribonuclease IV [Acidobacteriota bacterium]MBA3887515.1 deoxyribonuclease IV [Acidobacteriota bacterium]
MPRLGAHLSIAGGLPRAVDRAQASRCDALQIFTKSAGQWRARPLPPDEVALFRRRVEETGIHPVVAHNSYLINLAAADTALRAQSLAALGEELDRARLLGLDGLVMHPGSYTTGDVESGLQLIAEGLAELLRTRRGMRLRILLEHTAGQGTNLGHRFEHLRTLIERLNGSDQIGVCLDTCHLLAAGYDVCTEAGYRETFREFDRLVGLDRIKVFHLNDSKKPCGSRVDRHEHIGKGCLGIEPFRMLLNDPRFAGLPMLLETPKLDTPESRRKSDADPWDARNLRTLRTLLR